eukprot:363276-Chlamydomonas_euryale.AAC.11
MDVQASHQLYTGAKNSNAHQAGNAGCERWLNNQPAVPTADVRTERDKDGNAAWAQSQHSASRNDDLCHYRLALRASFSLIMSDRALWLPPISCMTSCQKSSPWLSVGRRAITSGLAAAVNHTPARHSDSNWRAFQPVYRRNQRNLSEGAKPPDTRAAASCGVRHSARGVAQVTSGFGAGPPRARRAKQRSCHTWLCHTCSSPGSTRRLRHT